MLTGNQIRKLYLDYFKNKHQHTVVIYENPLCTVWCGGDFSL